MQIWEPEAINEVSVQTIIFVFLFRSNPKLTKMKMKMMKIKMKMMKMKMKMMKIKVKMSMMMMKKVSHDDGYFVMKVILWWNLSRDESNLVMKVMIVKELMTGDVSPVAMFEKVMVRGPQKK